MTKLDRVFSSSNRAVRAVIGACLACVLAVQGMTHSAAAAPPKPTGMTWTQDPCRAEEICVAADGSVRRGPAELRGQGFLHGLTANTDPARVNTLKPKHWRLSDHNIYDMLRGTGAEITWIISDSWHGTTCTDGSPKCPLPPWEDWDKYESYVRALVNWTIQSGRPMDYWDVVNEPGWDSNVGTPAQYLEMLRRAHDAIRSVDPAAKISAPSLVAFADAPSGDGRLDLKTFLDYATTNDLHFDAISWHENMANTPQDIVDHVARARTLLAKYPGLDSTELHVGEFTPPASRRIPGWTLGWLAALEKADVDASFRACWWEQDPGQTPHSGCWPGVLDGLLMGDERTPRPAYWVYKTYADMTGSRLQTSTNESTVSLFATTDDTARDMRVFVGRHERCTAATNPDCYETTVAGPRPVNVRLRLPWKGATRAQITQIPNQGGSLSAPVSVGSLDRNPTGWSTLRLPSVADGDAYVITLRPAR